MLEITRIRAEKEVIIEGMKKRNLDVTPFLDSILEKDEQWRSKKTEMETVSAHLNGLAKEIGLLFKSGKVDEANQAKAKTTSLKESEAGLKTEVEAFENEIQELLYQIPNLTNKLVKAGKSELDNETVFEAGKEPAFNFEPLPHWELASKYNLIDFELGVKISGAGFPVYRGKGAKLQRALINFFLNEAENAGYEETQVPLVVNEASGIGTGQLPDKEGQMYHCQIDDLYLIPTAEVPLTNIYRDVILPDENYSIKLTGYTPCFRREA